MYGWTGQRLRIDLTHKTFEIENLPIEYYQKWIGGRGFNSEVVYHETWQDMNPFDPENPLCFVSSALAGTLAPLSAGLFISARSPLPCSIMDKDICGHGNTNLPGAFSALMKYTGYDQIIIKGKAPRPVVIFIDEDKVKFLPARDVWNLGTKKAVIKILEQLGDPDIRLLLIGPAGENKVLFSSVLESFNGSIGKNGLGAVMGSKKLKAIALRGKKPVHLAYPKRFTKACWNLRQKVEKILVSNQLRSNAAAPANNTTDHRKPAMETSSRQNSCWSCPVGCGRYTVIREGEYAGFHCNSMEANSLYVLGEGIEAGDDTSITVFCDILNDLGLEFGSVSRIIAWLKFAYDNRCLTKKDVGGIQLEFRDVNASIKLIEMIARRKGLGKSLADGRFFNVSELALNPSNCAIGRAYPFCNEFFQPGVNISLNSPKRLTDFLINESLYDLLGCCSRAPVLEGKKNFWKSDFLKLFRLATGIKLDHKTLLKSAERVLNIERATWLREGSAKQDDDHVAESCDQDPAGKKERQSTLKNAKYRKVQADYYRHWGWNKDGFITHKKAQELGIAEVIPDLRNGKKLYQEWLQTQKAEAK